jgi:hypothetical protein
MAPQIAVFERLLQLVEVLRGTAGTLGQVQRVMQQYQVSPHVPLRRRSQSAARQGARHGHGGH